MKIKEIKIKNFRCYENVKIKLNPDYTVLIGINGAGKSTILDAISIALGGYISTFDGMGTYGIDKSDSHYKMYEIGSSIEREHQFPVKFMLNVKLIKNRFHGEEVLMEKREEQLV